jgi:hypothetical protein
MPHILMFVLVVYTALSCECVCVLVYVYIHKCVWVGVCLYIGIPLWATTSTKVGLVQYFDTLISHCQVRVRHSHSQVRVHDSSEGGCKRDRLLQPG